MERLVNGLTRRTAVLTCILAMAGIMGTKLYGVTPEPNETCRYFALRGGFGDWPMGEREMLRDDPAILTQLVEFYEASENQPYWILIAENWMACGLYSLTDGRSYTGWQIGDLNLDGIVNFNDFATYAQVSSGL